MHSTFNEYNHLSDDKRNLNREEKAWAYNFEKEWVLLRVLDTTFSISQLTLDVAFWLRDRQI